MIDETETTKLPPGSFRVSDYREAIPFAVKLYTALRYVLFERPGDISFNLTMQFVRDLQFDHRPALQDRPYDLEVGDFDPPQNDPCFIFAVPKAKHLERTIGRKEGAEKTVCTRGSDIGEAKHIRKVKNTQALHKARMAMKGADPKALAEALDCVKPTRKKSKIPSRPFQKRRAA